MSIREATPVEVERWHDTNGYFSQLYNLGNETIWKWGPSVRLVVRRFGKVIGLTYPPCNRPWHKLRYEGPIEDCLRGLYWLTDEEIWHWEPVITDYILPRLQFLPNIRTPPSPSMPPAHEFLYRLLDTLRTREFFIRVDCAEFIRDFGRTLGLRKILVDLPKAALRERVILYLLACRYIAASHQETTVSFRQYAQEHGLCPGKNKGTINAAYNLGQKLLILEKGVNEPGVLLLMADARLDLLGLPLETVHEVSALLGIFLEFSGIVSCFGRASILGGHYQHVFRQTLSSLAASME